MPTAANEWVVTGETPLPSQDRKPSAPASWEIVSETPLSKSVSSQLVEKGRDILSQQEKDIDYTTGAAASTRMLFQRASNPKEAQLVLDKLYGKGNYGQDRFGQWWVNEAVSKPTGKGSVSVWDPGGSSTTENRRVSVLPKGVAGGARNAFTGLASSPGATAGAIAGGIGGEVLFPAGGGIPGAMIGAAAGKGLDELSKWASGLFAQKPSEVVGSMATEGAVAGLFQGAGPLARKAGQAVRAGFQNITGVTPTSSMMARDLSAGGAQPPVGSYAPGATALEYKRQLRDSLVGQGGTSAEKANVLYLDTRMQQVLTNEGLTPPEVTSIMNEVRDTSTRQSTREAGEAVVSRAQAINRDLLNDSAAARAGVERDLMANTATLRKYAEKAPLTLGQEISDAIISQRRDFSKRMSGIYQTIDRLTGDHEVVPVAGMQRAAQELIQVMPPQVVPPLIRQVADGSLWRQEGRNSPITHISFERAHALRSTFREMGEVIDASPQPLATGSVRKLASAVNTAIGSVDDKIGAQAAGFLKRADALYADGIRKYNSVQVNRIVRDMRSGIIPEPGTVARLFMTPDNIHLARTVLDQLPDKVRQSVIRADLGNMLDQASTRNAEGKLALDGKSFLDIIDSRLPLLEETYPIGRVMELRRHALNLAAFDGRIDVTGVARPTDIMNRLERGIAAIRAADEFAKNNPVGAFVSGNPAQVDRALARITQPGNEAVTEQAARTLDINSNAWWSVRKYALQKILASATVETRSLAKTVAGEPINQSLNRLTRRQQELLFPAGLADDLRVLAKEAKFLFPPSGNDMGTSLAAASIKSGLWLNPVSVFKYIRTSVSGYIADHPRLLQYLAGEIRRDPVRARGILRVLGQHIATRAVLSGPGKGKPGADAEPKRPVMSKAQARAPQYGGVD